MTDRRKKEIREYAEARGIRYTEAMTALEPQFDRPVRPGLDDLLGRIIEHPKVDMMMREDGKGVMNGSLEAEVVETWLPLLDLLTDERWSLMNTGPGFNTLLREIDKEEFLCDILVGSVRPADPELSEDEEVETADTVARGVDVIDVETKFGEGHIVFGKSTRENPDNYGPLRVILKDEVTPESVAAVLNELAAAQ